MNEHIGAQSDGRTCGFCGASIDHKRATARYCSKRCYHRSDDYKAARKRYEKSEKGAAAQKRAAARLNQTTTEIRRKAREHRVCVSCGVSISHRAAQAKYCSRRCYLRSPSYKRSQARSGKTAKAKATRRKYWQTPEGKDTKKRYEQSPKRKAALERYKQFPKGKAAIERRKQRMKTQHSDTDGTMAIARDLSSES